jgi:hypothetical protein
MVKFQPSKLAMRVRFPLPAHLPVKVTPKITGWWGANLVVALNIPIEFTLNFFATNREDSPGFLDRKRKRSRQIWIVFI